MTTVSASDQPFAIMVKPVGSRCNMQCRYCYYLGKEEQLAQDHPDGDPTSPSGIEPMRDELLEELIRQAIAASPGPVVSFTWHGGEPMLAGLDFYRRAVALEQKYLPAGWQVWNNLQTNGLLLNNSWCRFLRQNRFDVGLSIDGSQSVHDANRRDRGGNETYERVRQAARRLKAAGITPDLLCTVNSASAADPVSVYRSLRELGGTWLQFIPIVVRTPDGGFSEEFITPKGYGDFLCAVFDEWLTHDLGKLDVQLFAELSRIMAGESASVCWMAPTCGRVIVAEKDGALYSCDHFVDRDHCIGRLPEDSLQGCIDSPFQAAFGNAKRDALTSQCRACRWLPYCTGGCLKDRFAVSRDGESGHYYLCEGMEKFFAHACPKLEQVMGYSRRGYSPVQIMKLMKN